MKYVRDIWENGYAVVRDVYSASDISVIANEMDRLKSEALRFSTSHRERHLVHVIKSHPALGRHLRFIHWGAYISRILARYRIDQRQLELVEPLLGNNLKQIANQASWKTPGSDDTAFGFHQDARFRRPASAFRNLASSYVQTFLAIDPHRTENGCLKVYPGSHRFGILDFPENRSVLDLEHDNATLEQHGLIPDNVVNILLDPGDVALWLPNTLHASGPNHSTNDRRAYVNGYVIAENCDRGEWAFRQGKPCELGEPALIQYEDLYTRPEPHYIEGAIYPVRQ
jgi:ectoine hydroxylase-related dioxygenase (phytanoyl-CoA dioxygenase family)